MRTRLPFSLHTTRLWHETIRRHHSNDARFTANDFVILAAGRATPPIFAGPLRSGNSIETHKGNIKHDEIIGKLPRDVLTTRTNNGKEDTRYRLHEVKLEDYVQLSRRIVTPIYPQDASLIVSLLDLHPEHDELPGSHGSGRQIEILEAGTGHGALTLYLSRAVHAANAGRPREAKYESAEAYEFAMANWRPTRKAIVHSIESSEKHSKHAEKTVKAFRRGQYYDNVDFHVQDVTAWVKARTQDSGAPFLTHAFLDLPDVQRHVPTVSTIMKPNAPLIIFCPSISQITDVVSKIRKNNTPLDLDRVVELGVNGGTGGRLWDVRFVKPRAAAKLQEGAESAGPELSEESSNDVMVCRPKVGDRIAGGGFLAVFRRKRIDDCSPL